MLRVAMNWKKAPWVESTLRPCCHWQTKQLCKLMLVLSFACLFLRIQAGCATRGHAQCCISPLFRLTALQGRTVELDRPASTCPTRRCSALQGRVTLRAQSTFGFVQRS